MFGTLYRSLLLAVAAYIGLTLFAMAYDCYCKDGWLSHSCGTPGACSSHGGILGTATPPNTPTRTPSLTETPTRTGTTTPTVTPSHSPTPTPNPHCPDERAAVKLGTDADADLVNLTSAVPTTIEAMQGWPAPSIIPLRNRISPYETTVWALDAVLVEYKLETDSDYHLVLADANGNTLIAELTSPACASGSRFAPYISSARAEFDAVLSATPAFQPANIAVHVAGIGMFDFLHGQTGGAPNGIELHSVLYISFDAQRYRPPVNRVPAQHKPREVVH